MSYLVRANRCTSVIYFFKVPSGTPAVLVVCFFRDTVLSRLSNSGKCGRVVDP